MVRAGAEASGAGRSHCNGWTSSAGAYNRRVNATARQVFLSGLALAVAGSVMFSAKAIVVKLAYRHGVDAETLLALRMLIAVPFFVVALWWTSRDAAPLSGRDHGLLLIIGLLGYYLASYFDFLGLQYISAALERLILYLNPTLVLLLSVLVLRRPVTRFDLLALLLSYGGILLVFWHDVRLEADGVLLGAALVFGAAACYAVYLVLSGELVRKVSAIRLTAYAMCVATVGVCVQFAALRPLASLAQPAPVLWLSLINAVLCTVLPVFATMMAVARIGAGSVALAGMIGPVSTIALGYAFLGEPVSGSQLAGTTLVLAGVFVLSRKAGATSRSGRSTRRV
ncbi:MAG: DMT family transporter [Burkholderiales bacterium]|nr:MAG: DMT family transporter [Burkholderiales bacterium]